MDLKKMSEIAKKKLSDNMQILTEKVDEVLDKEVNKIKKEKTVKYCPICGVKMDKDARFCSQCGHKVENIISENQCDCLNVQDKKNQMPNHEKCIFATDSEENNKTSDLNSFESNHNEPIYRGVLEQESNEIKTENTIKAEGIETKEKDTIEIKDNELKEEIAIESRNAEIKKEHVIEIKEKLSKDGNALSKIKTKFNIFINMYGKIPFIMCIMFFALFMGALFMSRRISAIISVLQILLIIFVFFFKKYIGKNWMNRILIGFALLLLVPYIITFGIDYSNGHNFTWDEILMLCESFGEEKGIVSFSDTSVKNELYSKVEAQLNHVGFRSIEAVELKDLEEKNQLNGFVESISINNMSQFEENAVFPLSSEILIKYHSYAEKSLPIVSNRAKGKDFNEIEKLFKNSMFFNIEERVIEDVDDDNRYDDEIEYIEVNGDREYTLKNLYSIDTKVTLYHSYKKEILPIKMDEIKGKSYEEVFEIFKQSKFFNIESKIIEDQKYDNVLNDEMEYIEVVGQTDITSETKLPLDSTIILYHSYITDCMPILFEEAKGMGYTEIQELFATTLFNNVKNIANEEINELNAKEYVVEKILVNNQTDYTLEDRFCYDEEISIYYKKREYKVTLKFEGKKDAFFNEYDVKVLVDGKNLGTLAYGETKTFDMSLLKGKYKLEFISQEDESIRTEKEFNIKKDRTLRYKVSFGLDQIKVKYIKQLRVPYVNEEIKTMNVHDVERGFRDAGFKKVKLIELCDLSYDSTSSNNLSSRITISKNDTFTKDDSFYEDSPVEIEYHSMKKAVVPASKSEVKKMNYQTVEQKFKDAGFVNVSSTIYTGKYTYSVMNDQVHSVKINGEKSFYEGEEYPLDSRVEISYYSVKYEPVTVAKMMEDYKANAHNATNYYKDRYVSVTGIVHKISASGRKIELRSSDNSYTFDIMTCEIVDKSEMDKVVQLSAGSSVTVNGRITYVLGIFPEIYTVDIHDIIIN